MSRAGINLSDFAPTKEAILGEKPKGKEIFPSQEKPPVEPEKPTEQPKQEQKPQEKEQKISKESIKKNFKYQTFLISTKNLAFLKVLKDLKHIPQATYLDNLLDEHFKNQNFDDEIIKMVQNETERIENSLKTQK